MGSTRIVRLEHLFCFVLLFVGSQSKANWTEDKYKEVIAQLGRQVLSDPVLATYCTQSDSPTSTLVATSEVAIAVRSLCRPNPRDYQGTYKRFWEAFREASRSQLASSSPVSSETPAGKLSRVVYNSVDLTEFNSLLVDGVFVVPPRREDLVGTSSEASSVSLPTASPTSFVQGRVASVAREIDGLSAIHQKGRDAKSIGLARFVGQTVKGEFALADLDPNLQGNLISVKTRFSLRGQPDRTLLALRMPTQTIGSSGRVEIAPEFRMYLSTLQGAGLNHTYVNFQQIVKNQGKLMGYFGDEGPRARALHQLSTEHPNLVLVSLNKNNDFYHQKGRVWSGSMSFAAFKSAYLSMLVPNDRDEQSSFDQHGIRLDDLWRPEKFGRPREARDQMKSEAKTYLSDMLDRLAKVLYSIPPGRRELTSNERQQLVELSYHFISDYASRNSHSANRSCKDAIDRGGGANALAYTVTFLKEICDRGDAMSESDFDAHLSAIPGMIFSDALQVRKRGIIEERLHFYQDAMKGLLRSVQSKGCNEVFGESGLGPLFILSQPRFSKDVHSVPISPTLTAARTSRKASTIGISSSSEPCASPLAERLSPAPSSSYSTSPSSPHSSQLLQLQIFLEDLEAGRPLLEKHPANGVTLPAREE